MSDEEKEIELQKQQEGKLDDIMVIEEL